MKKNKINLNVVVFSFLLFFSRGNMKMRPIKKSFRILLLLISILSLTINQTAWAVGKDIYPSSITTQPTNGTYCQYATASALNIGITTTTCGASGGTTTINRTFTWYKTSISCSGGSVVFTDGPNANTSSTLSSSYISTATAGTDYYYCVVSWSAGANCAPAGSLTSSCAAIMVTPYSGNPCSYCTSTGTTNTAGYVSRVQFNSIDRSSGWDGGYYDATGTYSANVVKSLTYNLTLTRYNSSTYVLYTAAWIDFNQDGDFIDAGENVMTSISSTTPGDEPRTVSVTIPAGAVTGTTMLRVMMKYNAAPTGPCDNTTYMETEDYSINIQDPVNMAYSSSDVIQSNTNYVSQNSSNNDIIQIKITITGNINSLSATSFNLSTTGSTNPLGDITSAKLFYTGNSSIFSTNNLFGTNVNPNGAFVITGTQSLASGDNFFWLSYDVPATATLGDLLDAACASITVDGIPRTPTITNPAGSRTISNDMYYLSSTCAQITNSAGIGTANNEIIRIEAVTGGTTNPINATSFSMNTNGCTNPTNDILNAKIFYTGTSSTFSTATQLGTTVASPNGAFSISGFSQTLSSGTNYFWLSYDVKSTAATGNVIDGECTSLTVGGIPRAPSVTAPSGNRIISNTWKGTVSVDWSTGTNWSSGLVPTSSTDIFIPAGTPFACSTNSLSCTCGDLTVQQGCTLTVATVGTPTIKSLAVSGNLINNGTINHTGNIYVDFTGVSKVMKGTGVVMGNNGGFYEFDGSYTLGDNLTVGGIYVNGSLSLRTYTLIVNNTSTTKVDVVASGTLNLNSGTLQIEDAKPNFSGTFNADSGLVFYNITTQNDTVASATYYNLKINTASGFTMRTLNPVTVKSNLDIVGTGTVVPEGSLTVNGNFTNSALFSAGTSTVTLNGTLAQTIGGSSQTTFSNLTINNSSGISGGVTINVTGATKGAIVTGALTLTNGVLNTTSSQLLTLNNAATSTVGTASSFVNGPMKKLGNQAFVFPVGNIVGGTPYWRRIEMVTAPAATTSSFKAQYVHSGYGVYTPCASPTPVLTDVSHNEYWILDKLVADASSPQVKLYWEDAAASGLNPITITDLRVSHYNAGSSCWENNNDATTSTGSTSGSSPGTIATSAGVATFSPFTIGTKGPIPLSNSITTSPLGSSTLTRCTNFTVNYTISGTFAAGNVFTAQLSDASGNFATPTPIGSVTATVATPITAVIPSATPAGAGYRIRVVSSNPAVIGSDNGTNLTLAGDGGPGTWTWQGTNSTDWFDRCNWDKKTLPDASSDVSIPGGTPNQPTITGAAANCKTITINTTAGAVINLISSAGGILNIAQ